MELGLKNKVAVITGPAKGMGSVITTSLASEGVELALLGRDLEPIKMLAKQCETQGVKASVFKCDVTAELQVKESIEQVLKTFDQNIDILINIAGGTGPLGKDGVATSYDELNSIIQTNMIGPFNLIKHVSPVMIKNKKGKIINIGGTFGMRGRAGRLAYSGSKWGLRGITKSFALELGKHNINVNYIAPGMVDGDRFRKQVVPELAKRLGATEDEIISGHEKDYALGRLSTSQDIAYATLFLASDVSRQITGIDLPIDGGWAAI